VMVRTKQLYEAVLEVSAVVEKRVLRGVLAASVHVQPL